MDELISKIGDPRLKNIIDTVELGDNKKFKEILNKFSKYDPAFLWLLAYSHGETIKQRVFFGEGYKKFKDFLDPCFPKLLAENGGFESRMWELSLCIILSASNFLEKKEKSGVDFHLKTDTGEIVQIEAVAPNEADNKKNRSLRPPSLPSGDFFSFGGEIEDLEFPILLRVFDKGFIEKSERKEYDKNKPLIIAINSSKVVGLISDDEYVLRRILFGLKYLQVSKDGRVSFQQDAKLNKNNNSPNLAVFRNPDYDHVSGVIYTSQRSLGFSPNGYSWHNSGITFVPNPRAKHPANLDFPFFKKILCDEERYQRLDPTQSFYRLPKGRG